MLLNSIGYWAMNNALRSLVHKHYETPRLKAVAQGKAATVLEIGCGQGVGAKINHHTTHQFVSELKEIGFDTETYESNPVSLYYFWGGATETS